MDGSERIKSLKKFSCSDSDSKSHDHDHGKKNKNQSSYSTESCNDVSEPLLPQDLIFDILTFVSANCLINSARYVCKTWAAIITSFGYSKAHERRARSKYGLYVESFMSEFGSYSLEFKDDLNGEFERTELRIPRRMGKILCSCDGILLLSDHCFRQVFVVNPILKCWLRIPPFPISRQLTDATCQCAIAHVPRTSKFKLFLVDLLKISGVVRYVFYVLRIGIDNSWKEIARREPPPGWVSYLEPIYSGGNNLYWRTVDEVIVMDVDREIIVREYPLPPDTLLGHWLPKYLWTGNRLSCISPQGKCFSTLYKVFILDFDSGEWFLYHEIGPFDYVAAYGHELHVLFEIFRFWINDQIIFEANPEGNSPDREENFYFGYNVKTRKLTKIEGIDDGNFKVWLHSSSLVSLPYS
ncbi:uncharacterized protein LOC131618063 [Vicia villosa]|uniref:uncharacterized protein LOC131618063 n=1 Tax=Vicia villosa TaxID=3911 RepID=UPI00273B0D8D|nr:uncharacterized protein LOC131618063 [Vicia villosa]